jgi:MFS family permease
MPPSRPDNAPGSGPFAASGPTGPIQSAPDPRLLLWLTNVLALFSNLAWCTATPFIPVYLAAQGTPVVVVGSVIGAAAIVPLLISIHAGALADERGPIIVAYVSVMLFALAGVILTVLHGVWPVTAAYTLLGIGNIGFAVAPQAIIAAASAPATRVRNFGYYFLWSSAGAVVGPVIGGFAAGRFGYTAAFALVWVLMLPSLGVCAALRGVPAASQRTVSLATAHRFAGTIVRRQGVAAILFISFIVVCGQTLQQSFYPLYLNDVGLSSTLIGLVLAAGNLSSMLVRSFLSRGVAQFGYASLLLGATALAAIALGMTPLLRRFWPLVGASALMGVSTGFAQPLTMSLMVDFVAAEFWGVAIGVRQSVQRLASVVSPIVFGLVITASGIQWAFFLGALTLAGAVPIMARVTGRLPDRAVDAPASAAEACVQKSEAPSPNAPYTSGGGQ